MADKDNLEKIAAFSFPSNHLVNFQLMRDLEKAQTLKPEYFFFVGLVPGVSGDNGARTYDFQSGFSLKYGVHEISGLAFALKQAAQGHAKAINYTKFSKSASGSKSVTITEGPPKEFTNKSGVTTNIRQIFFSFINGSNVKQLTLTLDQAYSIGDTLEILFKKAADLEFSRTINTVSFTNNKQEYKNTFNNQQSVPKINQQPVDNDMDSDTNSNYLSNGFGGFGGNPFG